MRAGNNPESGMNAEPIRSDDPTEAAPAGPADMLARLLDLAQDASSYLRHHHQAAVRASAALLLAASLAACGPSSPSNTITPLTQEVRAGLPSSPGKYPLSSESLGRDAQGVYSFAWQQPGGTGEEWTPGSASLLRLAQSGTNELEVPPQGDPILHLRDDTPIGLVPSDGDPRTPTAQAGAMSSGGFLPWYPFFGMGPSFGASYYDPAPQTAPGAQTVQGSKVSTSAPPPASRVSGLAHAVSGQAGGTGSGTAASSRIGTGSSAVDGQAGGTGAGTAASGKSGANLPSSSGGIGAARSSGFSGGGGGFFGGSGG